MTEETQNDAPATKEVTPSTEPIVEAEPTQAAPKSLPEDQEYTASIQSYVCTTKDTGACTVYNY